MGRTFDDFLFRPQHSPVRRRRDVGLTMPLVKGIDLALPVLGANMDTVVGDEMAKTLALEGGIGFLHRNCSIVKQAKHVRYVKTRHSYVIEEPAVLERTAILAEARAAMLRLNASSFLIEKERGSGILDGIYSHRDVPLSTGSRDARPVSDFMTPRDRLVTRPPAVALEEAERTMFEHRIEKLPLVDEENRICGARHHARPEALQAEAPLDQGRPGPAAGGSRGRRCRGLPRTSSSPRRERGRRAPARRGARGFGDGRRGRGRASEAPRQPAPRRGQRRDWRGGGPSGRRRGRTRSR